MPFGRGKKTFKPVKNHKCVPHTAPPRQHAPASNAACSADCFNVLIWCVVVCLCCCVVVSLLALRCVDCRKGTKRYELHNYAQTTLGSGDVRSAVALPDGEDLNEWLAVHTVDFYNEVSLLYGTISDFCTPESCPTMSAGPECVLSLFVCRVHVCHWCCDHVLCLSLSLSVSLSLCPCMFLCLCLSLHASITVHRSASPRYQYLWADGTTIKSPIVVPAREYTELLMTWIESHINNEAMFPTSVDVPFPSKFMDTVKVIFKRLFRVYAHIYFEHFEKVVAVEAEPHLNTCFKHFVIFVQEHNLVDPKELEPLASLIDSLTKRDAAAAAGSGAGAGRGK